MEALNGSDNKNKGLNKRLINIHQLSQLLGLSINTLYTWVSQKRIPYVKCGRLTKFDLREIDKWIAENTVEERKFSFDID